MGFGPVDLLSRQSRHRIHSIRCAQPGSVSGDIDCSDDLCRNANFPGVRFDQIDPNLFNANPAPGFISLSQLRTNPRRPDGRYGAIFGISNNAWSYYNALQALWTKRLSQGLSAQLSYTWSKNIDTGSEATFVGAGDTNFLISETLGPRGNRGPSRLDQPQRFVASYTYQFPFGKGQSGFVGHLIGGWEMNGVVTLGWEIR